MIEIVAVLIHLETDSRAESVRSYRIQVLLLANENCRGGMTSRLEGRYSIVKLVGTDNASGGTKKDFLSHSVSLACIVLLFRQRRIEDFFF